MKKLYELIRNFIIDLDWMEVLRYFIVGLGSTAINVVTALLLKEKLGVDMFASNAVAWLVSTTFAFLANTFYVFKAKPENAKQFFAYMGKFFGERIFTLGVEELIFLVFYTWLGWPHRIVKICAQLVVIALNYIISKLIVYRKKPDNGTESEKNS